MSLLDRTGPIVRRLDNAQWLPQLLMRLFLGGFFALSGYRHVTNLDSVVENFSEWGIPMPHFNAVLSSYTELAGGALIILGLATRLAALPLAFNMLVAVLTVRLKKMHGLGDFLEADEPLYALVFLWLFFSGPGKASVDHFIAKLRGKAPETAPAALQTQAK